MGIWCDRTTGMAPEFTLYARLLVKLSDVFGVDAYMLVPTVMVYVRLGVEAPVTANSCFEAVYLATPIPTDGTEMAVIDLLGAPFASMDALEPYMHDDGCVRVMAQEVDIT